MHYLLLLVMVVACGGTGHVVARPPSHRVDPLFAARRVVVPDGVQALAVRGGSVYLVTYKDLLVAMSLDGATRFRVPLSATTNVASSGGVSIETVGDTVIVSGLEVAMAFDAANGDVRWKREGSLDRLDVELGDKVVHLTGEGVDEWIEIATGQPARPRVGTRAEPAIRVEPEFVGERMSIVARGAAAKELWRVDDVKTPPGATPQVQTERMTFINPLDADAGIDHFPSTVRALDSRTGALRWKLALPTPMSTLRYAHGAASGGIVWLVVDDIEAVRDGGYRRDWIAVTADTGRVLARLGTPAPEVKYCSSLAAWDVRDGVLAVSHEIKSADPDPDRCSIHVVDIYVPRRAPRATDVPLPITPAR